MSCSSVDSPAAVSVAEDQLSSGTAWTLATGAALHDEVGSRLAALFVLMVMMVCDSAVLRYDDPALSALSVAGDCFIYVAASGEGVSPQLPER